MLIDVTGCIKNKTKLRQCANRVHCIGVGNGNAELLISDIKYLISSYKKTKTSIIIFSFKEMKEK